MNIDMHCHVVGNGKDIRSAEHDVFFRPEDNQLLVTRVLATLVEDELRRMETDLDRDGIISTREYVEQLFRMLASSREIDAIVLLALDAVYDADTGRLDETRTDLWVTNRFLLGAIREMNDRLKRSEDARVAGKRFFLGASVSPNRRDWREELRFALEQQETVLLKLIPSAQHITLRDARHREFYETLAAARLPLLCHVGPEYSFPEGLRRRELDDFRFLDAPLECGATVIAAHCSTPVFPLADRNDTAAFAAFMHAANAGGQLRLWADTSALSLSTRLPFIPEILASFPPEWLVHGSDFPIPIDGWTHLPVLSRELTAEQLLAICTERNPLDRDVMLKRAHGFNDAILRNAERVLRLPE